MLRNQEQFSRIYIRFIKCIIWNIVIFSSSDNSEMDLFDCFLIIICILVI